MNSNDHFGQAGSSSLGGPFGCGGSAVLGHDDLYRVIQPGWTFRQREVSPAVHQTSFGVSAQEQLPRSISAPAESSVELSQSPIPVASWPASGSGECVSLSNCAGFPADPQIAVSATHVVVTARAVIAFYDKAGQLLQPPLTCASFFSPLGLFNPPYNIDYFFDARAIFDSYRGRFWIAALGSQGGTAGATKLLVGVSGSEDPTMGWYLYWWDAIAAPVFQIGDSADYPILGVDPVAFYQTNAVNNNGFRYWRVVFFPAADMANGLPGPSIQGWQFWGWPNPDGSQVSRIQPVVHHGLTSRTYFATRFGVDRVLIWTLADPLGPAQRLTRVIVQVARFGSPTPAPQRTPPGGVLPKPIETRNFGSDILKAIYRSDRLYLVANDARDWDNRGEVLTSVRFLRLNVARYFPNLAPSVGVEVDRVFGARSQVDDPPGAYAHYAWPAVEVTERGDAAVVYSRSGVSLYPEIRYSAYYANDPDIRPSRLVKAGEDAYAVTYSGYDPPTWAWADLAGASADPADHSAVWLAHEYAVARTPTTSPNGNFGVWVGKVRF